MSMLHKSSFVAPQPKASPELQATIRLVTISGLAAIIGIGAGVVAFVLYHLIAFFSNLFFFQRLSLDPPSLQLNQLGPLVIVVTVLGGLIVGVMAKYGSPKIKGHGIPEAMEAVLVNRSRIQPRVAILKPLSAAIAIGAGGPFGAEGPIIQTGGALGSVIGQMVHITAAERKVLLACGAAAGMAATFNTPIAAIILAIELLLFEFKSRSIIPLAIACTLATTVHSLLMGNSPMFQVAPIDFGIPSKLPFYVVLGLICGLAAVLLSKTLYWVEDQFERLPIDSMWWPAIGGLAVGVFGLIVPRVLGIGYDTIGDILNNRLTLAILISVMVFKALALVISLGSGTSGGLLAPMFMTGAALGGTFALVINGILPGANLAPGAFALVAMAAVFGSAARATLTLIIFAFEITHEYSAILPLILVCAIADGVARLFMRNSIMTEKLARRGLRVQQEYEANVFDTVHVASVMATDAATVPQTMTVEEAITKINAGDPVLTRHQALLVVDEQGALTGIVTRGDLVKALREGRPDHSLLDAGTPDPEVTYPDESVRDALTRMLQHNVGRLPVVDPAEPTHILGYLSRGSVMAAHLQRFQEENDVEPGWVRSGKPPHDRRNGNRVERQPSAHEV